jgi:hypothetical protein
MVCQVSGISTIYSVYRVIICLVESSDLVQSSTAEKGALTSKWELVDYGDDSDE